MSDRVVIYQGQGIDGAKWSIKQVIATEAKEQINYMSVLQTAASGSYICTMANDGVLKLYGSTNNNQSEMKEKSTLLFGRNL